MSSAMSIGRNYHQVYIDTVNLSGFLKITSVTATFYCIYIICWAGSIVNSNLIHTVFSCCVLFWCITSLLLDIGLVLAYLLFLIPKINIS